MLLACADSPADKKKATTAVVDAPPVTRERFKRPEHPRPAAPCMPDRLQFTVELTQFAEAYCAVPGEEPESVVTRPPALDACLQNDFLLWKNELNQEEQQAVLLIFMKLYRCHLEWFRAAYIFENEVDVGEPLHPLVEVMLRYQSRQREVANSSQAFECLENHPELATPEVLTELEGVMIMRELIDRQVWWDDSWDDEHNYVCEGIRQLPEWEELPDCSCPGGM